jgi:hypothetical protein
MIFQSLHIILSIPNSIFYFTPRDWPRGVMPLADTGSVGSAIGEVGSKEVWTREINRYPST